MEYCKKLASLFVVMAVVLLATVPPTALAARNEAVPFSTEANVDPTNIRNPLASILTVGKTNNDSCIAEGEFCLFGPMNCCDDCRCLGLCMLC